MSDEYLFLLEDLYECIDGIRSAAIVSIEGLIVHSILEEKISDLNLAAMTATINRIKIANEVK